jgi:nucleoside-diphosphate-sugar epimerase
MTAHAFIIGGTGQIGVAVARDLLKHGWTVMLAHRGGRSPPRDLLERGATTLALDRRQPGALSEAFRGADAVIDTVAFTADDADQLLELQENAGAFVVVSSASVYRDAAGRSLDEAGTGGFPELPEPISETQPTVDPGPETYSTQKVALERHLLDHALRPVTILRPCAIHGPGSIHPREWWFVKRMIDGRPQIPLAHSGRSRFHTSAVANIAAATRAALDTPGSRILNVGDPAALTVAEIGAAIAVPMGYRGEFVLVETDDPSGLGGTPWSTPRPFVLDMTSARDLEYVPATTYETAMPAVCAWLTEAGDAGDWRKAFPILAAYPGDLFDYAAEDRFLGMRRR